MTQFGQSVFRATTVTIYVPTGTAEVAEWQTQRIQNPPSERA